MSSKSLTLDDAEHIIPKVVQFPEIDSSFERVRPITDFRKDDYEARILYICRRKSHDAYDSMQAAEQTLYVLKCKVQAPSVLAGGLIEPIPGPSEYSIDEIRALTVFTDKCVSSLPHLVAWKTAVQNQDGLMPHGYIFYNVMTLMPGQNLMDFKFWSLTEPERKLIRAAFIPVIKEVWRLGFEPYDCALRNILWEPESQTLSLVDFEHWHPTKTDPINMTERLELEKWGIVHRAAPPSHWQEWFHSELSIARQGR